MLISTNCRQLRGRTKMDENIDDTVILHDGGMSATIYTSNIRANGSHKHGLDVIAAADMMLSFRIKIYMEGDSFVARVMVGGFGLFILGHFLTIHESFFTFHKQKADSDDVLRHPLRLESYIDPVGNKSYTINNRCFDSKTGALLIEERTTYSLVNLTTRRPQTFPEEIRQLARDNKITSMSKMTNFTWSKSDFDFQQEDIATSRAFLIEVTQKDIDHNGHVNFLVYPKVVFSCLKKMLGVNDDRKITCKHLNILYADESLVGDVLEYRLYVAKNTDVYVHIYRQDKCINKIKLASFYNETLEALTSPQSRL